jgi:hypothetical protein
MPHRRRAAFDFPLSRRMRTKIRPASERLEEMMVRRMLLVILTCIGACGGATTPVAAAPLTCPAAAGPTVIENPSSLKDLYSGATDVTAGNRLNELMAAFRASGRKPAFIVDDLVSAYCPLVAADTYLSDQQKVDRVRRFARQVTGLAYGLSDPDEVDVLLDIPLAPAVLSQIDQAAADAGMSRDAWIGLAIRQRLDSRQ